MVLYFDSMGLITVNAPDEYTLDFFFVGSDYVKQFSLEEMFLYDSNTTKNLVNSLYYLPRHKVYNNMRFYTSTSNSLTLLMNRAMITAFFRLREIHAENCESFDNVVTLYNSTVKAKSSDKGPCYVTVLNWNANTSWCHSQYIDLMTDSINNVKLVPDINKNYTFFEFNNKSVSTWSHLFFYGVSNTFVVPTNATLSFKSMTYTALNFSQGDEGYDEYNVTKGILTSRNFVYHNTRDMLRNTINVPAGVTCQFKIKFLDLSPNSTLYIYIATYINLKNVTKANQIFEFVAVTHPELVYIDLKEPDDLDKYGRGYVIEFEMIQANLTRFSSTSSPTLITNNGNTISSSTTDNPRGVESTKWWIIGGVLSIFIIITALVIVYFLRKKYKQKKFEKLQETIRIKMEMSPLEIKLSHEERLTKQLDPKNVIIDFDTILGKGANATVYKVYLKGTMKPNLAETNLKFATQVNENCYAALKLPTSFDQDEVEQFVRELDALITLGSHPNIITFIGWTLYHDIPALVTELASTNLLEYVKSFRGGEILPFKTVISFLWQISQALEQVASLNMVHRDVACRNILLTNGNSAKLADFGLCCHCDESFTYQATLHKRLPLKWLSIEALTERIFAEKSDVWSFGILCFEIFSFGKVPYLALSNEEMVEFLQAGNRLEKSTNTPDVIYSLMLECWKENPSDRPKFGEIVSSLRTMLENETASYGYLTLEAGE